MRCSVLFVDVEPEIVLFQSFELTSATSYDVRGICVDDMCNFLVYSNVVGRFTFITAVDTLEQFVFSI